MTSSVVPPWEVPPEWMDQWPRHLPGVAMLDLTESTWGPDGCKARRRSNASSRGNLVPLLGYPDPPAFPQMRLGWR